MTIEGCHIEAPVLVHLHRNGNIVKKYGLNKLAELNAHQICLKIAESREVFDVTPSSKARQPPTNRPQTSQTCQWRSLKRGQSADYRSSNVNVNISSNDENILATKVLRRSQDNSDISVHSIETVEGPGSISAFVRPFVGTLKEWHVYMRQQHLWRFSRQT